MANLPKSGKSAQNRQAAQICLSPKGTRESFGDGLAPAMIQFSDMFWVLGGTLTNTTWRRKGFFVTKPSVRLALLLLSVSAALAACGPLPSAPTRPPGRNPDTNRTHRHLGSHKESALHWSRILNFSRRPDWRPQRTDHPVSFLISLDGWLERPARWWPDLSLAHSEPGFFSWQRHALVFGDWHNLEVFCHDESSLRDAK